MTDRAAVVEAFRSRYTVMTEGSEPPPGALQDSDGVKSGAREGIGQGLWEWSLELRGVCWSPLERVGLADAAADGASGGILGNRGEQRRVSVQYKRRAAPRTAGVELRARYWGTSTQNPRTPAAESGSLARESGPEVQQD